VHSSATLIIGAQRGGGGTAPLTPTLTPTPSFKQPVGRIDNRR